jgi:hypothetical protein
MATKKKATKKPAAEKPAAKVGTANKGAAKLKQITKLAKQIRENEGKTTKQVDVYKKSWAASVKEAAKRLKTKAI